MKVTNIETFNFEGAFRGMRNPLESWDKSDSHTDSNGKCVLGNDDYTLANKLIKAGSDHRKFLRQIFISCDIDAPWYWWKEYATYKVGTAENSTSQMHKLGSRLLTPDDFQVDQWDDNFDAVLHILNSYIEHWQETKDKTTWRKMIQVMPGSYIYKRTCTLNYEVLLNMYNSRKNHKLILEYGDELIPFKEQKDFAIYKTGKYAVDVIVKRNSYGFMISRMVVFRTVE